MADGFSRRVLRPARSLLRRSGLTMRSSFGVSLLIALAGCSSTPELGAPEAPLPQASSELTVVVWSTVYQGAVPADGTLVNVGTGAEEPFSTRTNPTRGREFSGLRPGLYRVEVSHRYEDDERKAIEGSREVYLEPGQAATLTVVASDQQEELGFELRGGSLASSRG